MPSKKEFQRLNFDKLESVGKTADGSAILASYKQFRDQGFEHVGDVKGLGWVEIVTSAQAKYAAQISKTPVDIYFDAEKKDNEGRLPPHRWFMLVTAESNLFEGKVIVAAPWLGLRRRGVVTHVASHYAVAQGGADPYPDWTSEIVKLSVAVGIPMPPGDPEMTAYPEQPAGPSL